MRRGRQLLVAVGLTIAVVACGGGSGAVELLTGVDSTGCYAGGESHFEGQLVAGGEFGTMLDGKPIMWPIGWTGRRAGSEVEVLDSSGKVVATTGRRYNFAVGLISNPGDLERLQTLDAVAVSACAGDVREVK